MARPPTVYAFGLMFIAAIYVGLAMADGRPKVIVTECIVASVFVISLCSPPGWPPFCLMVDWVAAPLIAVAIIAELDVR